MIRLATDGALRRQLAALDTLDPLPDVAVCVVGLLGDQAVNRN